MGLTFQVGVPSAIFVDDAAAKHNDALRERFGVSLPAETDTWYSEDLGFSWVAKLQARTDAEAAPQLMACDSWMTVYLPAEIEVTSYAIGDETMICGSLPRLAAELEALAAAVGLPGPGEDRAALRQRYLDEDGVDCDDDPDLQALLWLLEGVRVATERALPLWVVK